MISFAELEFSYQLPELQSPIVPSCCFTQSKPLSTSSSCRFNNSATFEHLTSCRAPDHKERQWSSITPAVPVTRVSLHNYAALPRSQPQIKRTNDNLAFFSSRVLLQKKYRFLHFSLNLRIIIEDRIDSHLSRCIFLFKFLPFELLSKMCFFSSLPFPLP